MLTDIRYVGTYPPYPLDYMMHGTPRVQAVVKPTQYQPGTTTGHATPEGHDVYQHDQQGVQHDQQDVVQKEKEEDAPDEFIFEDYDP